MATASKKSGRLRAHLALAVLAVAGIAVGCGTPTAPAERTATSRQALASSNGLSQNGLTTNGLVSNGAWFNGAWFNGAWFNGAWFNGAWFNGAWFNGAWFNGAWFNGAWFNGLFSNNLWAIGSSSDGGPPAPGSPAAALQSSPYLRQLLPYVYGCAMPGKLDPITNTPIDPTTYNTTVDPNNGALLCAPPDVAGEEAGADGGPACPDGYTCSAKGTCVIALHGEIGLAINANGSAWWGETADGGVGEAGVGDGGVAAGEVGGAPGTCDESCQRWVSACVLARTNAYGAHVEISMRAPADAPQAIKYALAVSDVERNGSDAGDAAAAPFLLREGAYYGNIFETAPVPATPPDAGDAGYTGPATGPVVEVPAFYACAGPESNVPELTKRFCSSQGDQVVINVPGVCLTATTDAGVLEPGACAGEDTDASSPTFGAIQDCFTSTSPPNPTQSWQPTPPQPPVEYTQVITVYLKQPIAVCGNGVCEPPGETATNCATDCHPGTWARNFVSVEQASPNGGGPPADIVQTNLGNVFPQDVGARMSAVAPDDNGVWQDVVLAGFTGNDVDLGCGPRPASQGLGVLAEYDSSGNCVWAVRFGNPSQDGGSGPLQEVDGVSVAQNGTITVIGSAAGSVVNDAGQPVPSQILLVSMYSNEGVSTGTWSVPVSSTSPVNGPSSSVNLSRAFVVDPQGNVILGGQYHGTVTFGSSTSLTDTYAMYDSSFVVKLTPRGPAWAEDVGPYDYPTSLAVDSNDNIIMTSYSPYKTIEIPAIVQKFCSDGSSDSTTVCPDGSKPWLNNGFFLLWGANVDSSGDVYITGQGFSGQTIDGVTLPANTDIMPFIMKFGGADGSLKWANYAYFVCPTGTPNCQRQGVMGMNVGFDSAGNVVLGSFGNPVVGGGIDFGVGTFPTYPAYGANNIFVSAYSRGTGQLQWAKQIPTVLESSLLGMAIDGQGRVIVSGNYSGSMEFDGQLLATAVPEQPGNVNSFIASFGGPPPGDTTPPGIGAGFDPSGASIHTVPSDIVAQATSQCGANVFYMPPTAIDHGSVGGYAGTTVSCSPPPNTIFPITSTPVTCTASLGNGSSQSTAKFTVTVADTLPPVFLPFADITVKGASANGATAVYSPTATDQVDCSTSAAPDAGAPCTPTLAPCTPVSCTPASGSVFNIGTTPVTCTATDNAHNTSQMTFSVTVTPSPPVLTVPGAVSATATSASGAIVGYSASATDPIDGTVPVTCTPPSGSLFPIGSTTVTCTATDSAGISASASFPVTVVDAPPSISISVPARTAATSAAGAVVGYSATATDFADGTDPVSCSPASGSTFPIGSTPVNCTATNEAGQSSSASSTVVVADITPPTLTVPSNITTASTSASGAVVSYSASAIDPVDGPVTPVCAPPSGSTFAIGTTPVTCTATDSAGNKASASFTVTVVPNIGSFAVYATEAVELNSNTSVTGCNVGVENTGGPFLAGGAAAYLSSGAKIQSSQTLFASSVYLSSGASLGPLYTNNVMASSGATHGKVSTFPVMPAAPAAPSATAGSTAVTVSAGASKTLASGAYGSVTVNSGATLKLTGGTYVFSSLTLSSGATLAVSAATVLSVTGAASFSSSSSLGPASGSGLTAKALAVYFDGSWGINVTSGAKVRALLVAPKALVTVSTSSFTGAITAAQVLMNAGATVTCEDGLGSLPGQ